MRLLVIAGLVTISTAAFAGGKPAGVLVPPMEATVGAATPIGESTPIANSMELHIGMHWASLAWKPTRLDIGIGYAGSYRTLPSGSTDSLRPQAASVEAPELRMHGMYFSVAYAIESHRHWRTWLGARAETLSTDYHDRSMQVFGGSVRLGAEVFSAGVGAAGDHNALAFLAGAFAVGLYVEGTARTLPDELGPVGVGAGVSMRVPFMLAVAD